MDYQLRDLLQNHGLRNTTARQAVFKVFKSGPAITTKELSDQTADKLDTASLYRTLTLFRDLGIIQDVVVGGSRKIELTDAFAPHHHHISCSKCGAATAIHNDGFEKQIENLATSYGYIHSSHSFEITGICPTCQLIK